jgi:hypothetical protein
MVCEGKFNRFLLFLCKTKEKSLKMYVSNSLKTFAVLPKNNL